MKQNKIIIAIDGDGTCWTHDWPRMGKDIGAAPILKKLIKSGHKLMLWTMRSGKDGNDTLDDAINWFKENEIELWGINENPEQQANKWSTSNKQHANLFVDDAALGAPLKFDPTFHNRPFIDWEKVDKMLEEMGLYNS